MGLLKPKLPDNCSREALDAFDLTYSDDNADWTLCNSPSWSISSNDDDLPQVRAMLDATSPVEIILDSGADVSALPRTYGNVGVEVGQHESQFTDAQGSPLHVHSTRIANVIFGDVVIKERFIVTDVSIPILALGHLVRAGWSLQANGNEQHLVKGNKSFKVGFKRSSLCAVGCINMIANSTTDEVAVKHSDDANNIDSAGSASGFYAAESRASGFCATEPRGTGFCAAEPGARLVDYASGSFQSWLSMQSHCNQSWSI